MCKGKKKPMNICLGRGGEACVGFRSLRWPTCAVVGCCGPSWACVGLPWAAVGLRAFVGRRWMLWAFVGLRWPALTCVGRRWALWACVGLPWAAVDLCWPSLVVIGCCGPSWACVGLPWAFVAVVRAEEGCCGSGSRLVIKIL